MSHSFGPLVLEIGCSIGLFRAQPRSDNAPTVANRTRKCPLSKSASALSGRLSGLSKVLQAGLYDSEFILDLEKR